MNPNPANKTYAQLKAEHPIERFVDALGKVTNLIVNNTHPFPIETLRALHEEDALAFEIFIAVTYYGFSKE